MIELKCPKCACINVHIWEVTVDQGHQITKTNGDGTLTYPSQPRRPGSHIRIEFACEQNHRWIHSIEFCKGVTFLSNEILSDGPFSGGLWRK